jgi:hypothetical protein
VLHPDKKLIERKVVKIVIFHVGFIRLLLASFYWSYYARSFIF